MIVIKRLILLVVAMLQSLSAFSDELAYTRDDVQDYLASTSDAYEVVKIGGKLSYDDFKEYLGANISDNDEMYNLWRSHSQYEGEYFLVTRNYKGDRPVGSILKAKLISSTNTLQDLGKSYIVFFRDDIEYHVSTKSDFYYGDCDIFPEKKVPSKVKEDFSELVKYLSDGSLTPCLIDVKYDDEISK